MIYPVKKADGLLFCVRDFDKKLDAVADRRVLSCARSHARADERRYEAHPESSSGHIQSAQAHTGEHRRTADEGKYLPVSAIAVIGRSKSE